MKLIHLGEVVFMETNHYILLTEPRHPNGVTRHHQDTRSRQEKLNKWLIPDKYGLEFT